MKIKQINKSTPNFDTFMLEGWKQIHQEHYGTELDFSYWHTKHLLLKAVEGKEMIGGLIGEYTAGVLFIPELMVARTHRGKGVGKSLLAHAEDWTKQHRGHEVYLMTGKNWKEQEFYLKVGYEVVVELPRHYQKTDFVLMRKFLEEKL